MRNNEKRLTKKMEDPALYEKLALVDAIRLRNPRETVIAMKHLNEMILHGGKY